MKRIRDRVAGLDVHKDSVVACAQVREGPEVVVHKARFGTTTAQVAELAEWLADLGVTTVAMEATGVYWKPIYYGLEGLFEELWLCNAQHVKNVPGRKTDMADAEWLADVAAHGMVRPSVVPEPAMREVRELTRYRKSLVDERVREIQTAGKRTARRRHQAVLGGLAAHDQVGAGHGRSADKGRARPQGAGRLGPGQDAPEIAAPEQALVGRFSAHHAVIARQVLAHIDFLDASVAELDQAMRERMGPFEARSACWWSMVGWGRAHGRGVLGRDGRGHGPVPLRRAPGLLVPDLPG